MTLRTLTAKLFIEVLLIAASSSMAAAATYYVDYASGADTNNGISKSSSWKRAPGMNGCSGTCHSTNLNPGDSVIFKGGVTWDHNAFAMSVNWSGTPGHPIYFGVDKTWYAGSSWTRPIFSGDHSQLPSGDGLVSISYQNYITIDNIEFKGHTAYNNWGPASIELACTTYVLLTNLFVHDWALATSVANDDAHGGIFANNASCNPAGTVIDHSVISNSEHTGARQNGVAVRSTDIQFSVIHDVSSAQLFGRVHDSLIYNVSYPSGNATFDSSYHTNVTYIAEWDGNGKVPVSPAYIYNNVIHDFAAGSGGLYPNICGTAANATYMWNNVVYNNYAGGNSDIQIDPYGQSSGCGVYYIWNNTLQVPATTGSSAIRIVNRGFAIGTVFLQNNHFVSDSGTFNSGGGVQNLTNSNNTSQTNPQAAAQGYTAAETYAFSPIAGNIATIGAGVNLSTNCSTLARLCSDTTYAVGLDPNTNSVTVARTTNPRPSSGVWDSGGYLFGSGAGQPAPPTNLTATPH